MRITMNDMNRETLQHNRLPDLVLDKLMEWIMSAPQVPDRLDAVGPG